MTTRNEITNLVRHPANAVLFERPCHFRGPHFRDYHRLLDEPGEQVFAMTDHLAQTVRQLGGALVRSIGNVVRLQHVADNDAKYVEPRDMIGGLSAGNQALIPSRIETRRSNDVANRDNSAMRAGFPPGQHSAMRNNAS